MAAGRRAPRLCTQHWKRSEGSTHLRCGRTLGESEVFARRPIGVGAWKALAAAIHASSAVHRAYIMRLHRRHRQSAARERDSPPRRRAQMVTPRTGRRGRAGQGATQQRGARTTWPRAACRSGFSHTRAGYAACPHARGAAPPPMHPTARLRDATAALAVRNALASAPRPAAAGARAAVRAAIRATGRRPYVIGKELCRLCAAPDGSRVRARCVTEPPFS